MNINNLIVAKLKLYPFACTCVLVGLVAIVTWQVRNTQPDELTLYSNEVSKDHTVLNENDINGKDLFRDLEKATKIEKRIKAALLDPTDLIVARTSMDQMAAIHKVELIGQPSTEVSKPGRKDRPVLTVYQPVQFKLNISGTPNNIAAFLKHLESNPAQFCRIDEVTFVPDNSAAGKISANVTFDVLGIKK